MYITPFTRFTKKNLVYTSCRDGLRGAQKSVQAQKAVKWKALSDLKRGQFIWIGELFLYVTYKYKIQKS